MNYEDNVLHSEFFDPLKGFTLGLEHERTMRASGGYRPIYFGWDRTGTKVITLVYQDDLSRGTQTHLYGTMHLRVPRCESWALHSLPDIDLRNQLRGYHSLDAITIKRRFEAREFDPLLFSCLAQQWFSELRNEGQPRAGTSCAQAVSHSP